MMELTRGDKAIMAVLFEVDQVLPRIGVHCSLIEAVSASSLTLINSLLHYNLNVANR